MRSKINRLKKNRNSKKKRNSKIKKAGSKQILATAGIGALMAWLRRSHANGSPQEDVMTNHNQTEFNNPTNQALLLSLKHKVPNHIIDMMIHEKKIRKHQLLIRTDDDIRVAADDWCNDPVAAEKQYGHISQWNTSSVTNMSELFSSYTIEDCLDYHEETAKKSFNEDISRWDVSNVTNMSYMFNNAQSFNQDISRWDVSNVTDMRGMFKCAIKFNQDIRGWNVSSVTNMNSMFLRAYNFNYDLSGWNVTSVIDRRNIFKNAFRLSGDSWKIPKWYRGSLY